MQRISVTYVTKIVDVASEIKKEFGNVVDEDNYFVIAGLPAEHIPTFLKEITSFRGCSQRSVKDGAREDGRLRINWD